MGGRAEGCALESGQPDKQVKALGKATTVNRSVCLEHGQQGEGEQKTRLDSSLGRVKEESVESS